MNRLVKPGATSAAASASASAAPQKGASQQQQQQHVPLEEAENMCLWALRSLISLTAGSNNGIRLVEFLNKNIRIIEDCATHAYSPSIRIATLSLLRNFITVLRRLRRAQHLNSALKEQISSSISGVISLQKFSVEMFSAWVLKLSQDTETEVVAAAFDFLREAMGVQGGAPAHFHLETLPIRVSKEGMEWVRFMISNIDILLGRVQRMDVARRTPAFRPLTIAALTMLQDEKMQPGLAQTKIAQLLELMMPAISCFDNSAVLEAAHCLLLLAVDSHAPQDLAPSTNSLVDDAAYALLLLIDRGEAQQQNDNIIKDICAVLHLLRDKYAFCARLVQRVPEVLDDENRMFLLATIYRTVLQCSLRDRLAQIILQRDGASANDATTASRAHFAAAMHESDLERFCKEPIVQRCWFQPSDLYEARLRCEMLFCLCKEYLSLMPHVSPNDDASQASDTDDDDIAEMQAWLDVGIEACLNAKACLAWTSSGTLQQSGLYSCVAVFGIALTRICQTVYPPVGFAPHSQRLLRLGSLERRKAIQAILEQILDILPKMQTEFSEVISMSILSSFIEFGKSLAGRDTVDIIFDHIRYLISTILKNGGIIDKRRIETLLSCILTVCVRFSIKLQDAYLYLKTALDVWQQPAIAGTSLAIANSGSKQAEEIYNSLNSAFKKIEHAIKYNVSQNSNNNPELQQLFGRAFADDHPIFKSYAGNESDQLLRCYIRAFQIRQDINSRLHEEDQEADDCTTHVRVNPVRVVAMKHGSSNATQTAIISLPSDPMVITATYELIPEDYTVMLHVNIRNATFGADIYQVQVEIGVDGALSLFEASQPLPTYSACGDIAVGKSINFSQQFILDQQFSLARFLVTVKFSPTRKSATEGADILGDMGGNASKRKDATMLSVRCRPLYIRFSDQLRPPVAMSHEDFLTLWEFFSSSTHRKVSVTLQQPLVSSYQSIQGQSSPVLSTAQASPLQIAQQTEAIVDQIMFQGNMSRQNVFLKIRQDHGRELIRKTTNALVQLCYAARTLFDEFVLVVVFCSAIHDPSTGTAVQVSCDFEFRTSDENVLQYLMSQRDADGSWFVCEMLSNVVPSLHASIELLAEGSRERQLRDATSNIDADYNALDVTQSFSINENQLAVLHLRRWHLLRQQRQQHAATAAASPAAASQ